MAYLATGAPKYRERAQAVFDRVESAFYDPSARLYRPVEGDTSLSVTYTPRRFGLLQAMLRDMYELVGVLPGNDALAALILDRVGRLNKLVLNGWDDRDGDQLVEWPSECAHLGTGPDGQPLGLGGLQMAERVLTGESGSASDLFDAGSRVVATDREHDCVPEVSREGIAGGARQLGHLHADAVDAGPAGPGLGRRWLGDAVSSSGATGVGGRGSREACSRAPARAGAEAQAGRP